jgi:hypothetical protein
MDFMDVDNARRFGVVAYPDAAEQRYQGAYSTVYALLGANLAFTERMCPVLDTLDEVMELKLIEVR